MPKYDVTAPDGQKFEVNAPDGATEQDAISYVQREFYSTKKVSIPEPEKQFGQKVDSTLGNVTPSNAARQVGLTGRYALQGVGDVLDFLSSPIRVGLNAVLPDDMQIKGRTGEAIADTVGLPKPQGTLENTVGAATEFGFGAAVPLKLAQTVGQVPLSPVSKYLSGITGQTGKPFATSPSMDIARTMTANPGIQVSSAASAGGASEYVKQTGGSPLAQFAVSVPAALAPQAAMSTANFATNAVKNLVRKPTVQNIDIAIQQILDSGGTGIKFDQVAGNVRNQLRADVANAMKGGNLDEAALRRLVDYRLVGATPTRGTITLDPAQITREKNLAKIGMNTNEPDLQILGNIQNRNNQAFIAGLNDLGANSADDAVSAGKKVIGALDARNTAKQKGISALYDAAKASVGKNVDVPMSGLADDYGKVLSEFGADNIPSAVKAKLDSFGVTGLKQTKAYTIDEAESLIKTINSNYDPTNRVQATALNKLRAAVQNSIDSIADTSTIGAEAATAFRNARAANRNWMNIVDKTPAMQAVRDGVEPDKFVNQFIIGSGSNASVMDVARLKANIKGSPEAVDAVRGQIMSYLKGKALNGATDELGNFSQSAFNKAVESIGERKLRLFFSTDEVNQLKAIGRVAGYDQFQPRGSAVNNSNSGALALGNVLDWMANSKFLSRVPGADMLVRTPARNWATQVQIGNATNVTPGLLAQQPKHPWMPPLGLLMAPAAATTQ